MSEKKDPLDIELDKKFHRRLISNSNTGIHALRKLIEGNESYPPPIDLWQQMIYQIKKDPLIKAENKVTNDLDRELKKLDQGYYQPSLPEPTLARFYYQGVYYYLDGKRQIYTADATEPLIGVLAGEIKDNGEVYLNQRHVLTLETTQVEQKEIHQKIFYLDSEKSVYEGVHPMLNYLSKMGTLTEEGRIQLAT